MYAGSWCIWISTPCMSAYSYPYHLYIFMWHMNSYVTCHVHTSMSHMNSYVTCHTCISTHMWHVTYTMSHMITYVTGIISIHSSTSYGDGVATISRLLKFISLFCRIKSLLWGSFAKETCNFKSSTLYGYEYSCHISMWHGYSYPYTVLLLKLQVSFAKEPHKRDYILQKRPITLSAARYMDMNIHVTWICEMDIRIKCDIDIHTTFYMWQRSYPYIAARYMWHGYLYRVAKWQTLLNKYISIGCLKSIGLNIHRMPGVAGHFSQKSH